ncbi:TonB-dependent receptor [Christiangramia aquimixticola]|uniref:TonB-dependent receptor n=1 Tax=Christiangramia aquimixticola TaxID=1697558 RepID=UPI003AA97571
MKKNFLILLVLLVCNISVTAQVDSINWLQEVRLSDVMLKTHSGGQIVKELNDSVINKNQPSLTQLLKFNSPLFFRENGNGMVSSASSRGTGAAHTAVVWNGININSQLTGQTDFNAVNGKLYNNVKLKSGGGSVVYGSGAIGGSIHLNNEMSFTPGNSQLIQAGYGSFDTYEAVYKGAFSNNENSLNFGFGGIASNNDYKYPGEDLKNQNGDFKNFSFNIAAGRWFNDKNLIKFYSNFYKGARGFSGTLNIESKSKFVDENFKNLLEWKAFHGDLVSSLKLAQLNESYRYFENRETKDHSVGKANSLIGKYELKYKLDKSRSLNFIADITKISGKGSEISQDDRVNTGFSVFWKQELPKLNYEFSLRQELNKDYDSPLLFSAGMDYLVLDQYSIGLNISRNYRLPSMNDLFWVQGGNPDLKPEKSYQAEISNVIQLKNLEFGFTTFYIDLDQIIRWTPNNAGVWTPENTAEVYNYGVEVFLTAQPVIGQRHLRISGNYAFTKSIDQSSGNQLIYTPLHKANLTAAYELDRFIFSLKSLYHGSIYTSSDNQYYLEDYSIAGLEISYRLLKEPSLELGAEINNIFNTKYQSLPGRIMPGRSFNTHLTFKF